VSARLFPCSFKKGMQGTREERTSRTGDVWDKREGKYDSSRPKYYNNRQMETAEAEKRQEYGKLARERPVVRLNCR